VDAERVGTCFLAAVFGLFTASCARVPSPLAPNLHGGIGMPHRGVLTEPAALPRTGPGFVWLRDDERHFGIPRFVHALERAAERVATERPGARLAVGDLSLRSGGRLMPHLSHRTGRDADLLLYMTTLDGAPVDSPGFVHVEADGLAWDETHHRFLRFDVEREWLLVKTLVMDEDARIQWVFASRTVEAILMEWARARGESGEVMLRAQEAMLQPVPGGVHDDHVHVRTQCAPDEVLAGCEPTGPARHWIAMGPTPAPVATALPSDAELAMELLRPLDAAPLAAGTQ
jgi:penicillin-insensitive murein DD-endopeptidase